MNENVPQDQVLPARPPVLPPINVTVVDWVVYGNVYRAAESVGFPDGLTELVIEKTEKGCTVTVKGHPRLEKHLTVNGQKITGLKQGEGHWQAELGREELAKILRG